MFVTVSLSTYIYNNHNLGSHADTFYFLLGFPYGSWFDYELAMEQAEKDHPGMIYTIQYEQMKKVWVVSCVSTKSFIIQL